MSESEGVANNDMDKIPDADDVLQESVLQNDVVLRTIFKFLDFESLKACRRVHPKWKQVVEPSFRRRAKVNCVQGDTADISILQRLFSQDFEVSITTLVLGGQIQWKASQLEDFFANEGLSIPDITFDNLTVLRGCGARYVTFDAMRFSLSSQKRINIIHDVEDCTRLISTMFSVSTDALQSLDYLSLQNCKIMIGNEYLSPIELVLDGQNEFIWKGQKMKAKVLPLNDFVNFRRLERMTVTDRHCRMSVDFTGSAALKHLKLSQNIQLLNWESCQWNIESLHLEGIDFVRRSQIPQMVKTLHITRSKIDLSLLPETVESLTLESCTEIKLLSQLNVPHLKHLRSVNNTSFDFLAYFKTCDTLTEIALL